jgi:hypothetical protein
MRDIKKTREDLGNPYKIIWEIITGELKDTEAIDSYNYSLAYFKDTFEYEYIKKNYDTFCSLLKQRSDLNIRKE